MYFVYLFIHWRFFYFVYPFSVVFHRFKNMFMRYLGIIYALHLYWCIYVKNAAEISIIIIIIMKSGKYHAHAFHHFNYTTHYNNYLEISNELKTRNCLNFGGFFQLIKQHLSIKPMSFEIFHQNPKSFGTFSVNSFSKIFKQTENTNIWCVHENR